MQLSGEELHSVSERDSTGGAGSGGSDAASPLTARSIRLERVAQVLAHSQEELRRYKFVAIYKLQTFSNYI